MHVHRAGRIHIESEYSFRYVVLLRLEDVYKNAWQKMEA